MFVFDRMFAFFFQITILLFRFCFEEMPNWRRADCIKLGDLNSSCPVFIEKGHPLNMPTRNGDYSSIVYK